MVRNRAFPVIGSILIAYLVSESAFAQQAACPIRGLSRRLQPSCARVDQIHDPARYLNLRVGDTPRDGLCMRAVEARAMENQICQGVAMGMLQVRDGAVAIPFRILLMSNFTLLREGVELTEEGEVLVKLDHASSRLVLDANGKYARSGAGGSHDFRARLSLPLRPRTAARPPGAHDNERHAEATISQHVEPAPPALSSAQAAARASAGH